MAVEGASNKDESDGIRAEPPDGHVIGERIRRTSSETGPNKCSRMEGDLSPSNGHSLQEKDQQQPFAGEDPGGATNPFASKDRQPLTREIYRIPSQAGWFSWMKINNIERSAMSEFFDGKSMSKTPKIYKDYRDFIINKYRENMQRALTFTEVRRMLIGDVNALRRVFDFLDHWGLINHQVSPEPNEATLGGAPPPATVIEPIPSGVRVAFGPVSAAARPPQSDSHMGVSCSVPGPVENMSSYKNIFIPAPEDGVALVSAGSGKSDPRYTCNSCGGDCTKLLFRCRDEIQEGFNLCATCFKNGKYGPGMIARDFTRIEAETEAVVDKWTTKEILLLLEAITRFGDNWNQVADYVGAKSKSECVKQFIRLPFGDRFLSDAGFDDPVSCDREDSTNTSVGEVTDKSSTQKNVSGGVSGGHVNANTISAVQGTIDGDGTAGPSVSTDTVIKEETSPFADASNPIIAQVAFMSAVAGPHIAAAAAQAAIMTISEEGPDGVNLSVLNGYNNQSVVPKEGVSTGPKNLDSLKEFYKLDTKQGPQPTQGEKDVDNLPAVALIQGGIGTALGAAAANAKLLADQEDREMEHLMSDIIGNQLKRLYAKLEHFEELEMLVEKERLQLEQARQLLSAHYIQFAESRFHLNRERHG